METLEILKYGVILIHILLTCLTVSVVIFLCFEWKNSTSIFRSSYFVILNFGYFEDVIFSIFNIYGHLINYDSNNLLLPLILFVEWHSYNILGFWEAVIGFNRCTALGFPMAHRKIWSKFATGLFILAIIAFPFIADWYSFTNTLCKIFSKPECPDYLSFTNTNTAYINIALSIISTPLILFGIYKSPKSQTSKANIERRLIIQTLFSSASITALFSITLFAAFIQISYEKASIFGYIIYIIQFYPSIFILFYVSPVFRKNFIQFYKLNYIFGGEKLAPPSRLCSSESESIGREFIDNWSHYISLLETNTERDVLDLLNLLENVRVKWQKSEVEAKHYKDKLVTYEKNMKAMLDENNSLNDKLLNCQSQLSHVSECKRAVEEELADYKDQWEKLRSIIKENDQTFVSDGLLAIINNVQRSSSVRRNITQEVTTKTLFEEEENDEVSTMESTQSDIDYDKTGESSDSSFENPRRASRKRRSRSQVPKSSRTTVRFGQSSIKEEPELESNPSKRSRNNEDTEITATIRIDPSGGRKPSADINIRRSLNSSMSESSLVEKKEKLALKPKPMTPYGAGRSTYDLRSPHAIASSWTRGQEIERRTHRARTFIPVFEACDVCTKHFGLTAALKCVDCNIRFHRQCQSRAPMPCVPKVPMPKTPSKQKCPLNQYCPDAHPFIPPLMIHCVVALESDRLTKEGIYRVPGVDQAVGKLYQEFMSERKVPNFSNVETENITGCIKRFLRELRDSLIPSTSYDDFIRAVESNDEQQLIQVVFELSAPNRDTLAYFILHLLKVAKNASHNKMPIENLAKVLAPTVVGYSKLVTPCLENANELNRNQYMILLRLLKIPSEFWSRFIENNMGAVLAAEARTPGSKTALLTVTPTKPASSCSRRAGFNNNTTLMEFQSEDTTQKSANSSPLIQPLSEPSTTMHGIKFLPSFKFLVSSAFYRLLL